MSKEDSVKVATSPFDQAWSRFIEELHAEMFPDLRPDQEGDVALLVKKMFVTRLAGDAFLAGWRAARGEEDGPREEYDER